MWRKARQTCAARPGCSIAFPETSHTAVCFSVLRSLSAWCACARAADKQSRSGAGLTPATSAGSLGEQTSAHATPSPDDALDNPVLEQADEERNITYMQSHITFKYNHDEYDGGSSGDLVQVDWLQSFASSNRMAAGIELPLVHFNGSNGEPGGSGLGDIKLQFRGMLGKWEKFEHAGGIEITVPSASNDLVGENETVIRLVWGFSAQVTPHTMLSGELGYNKAVQTSHALTGTNEKGVPPALPGRHPKFDRSGSPSKKLQA